MARRASGGRGLISKVLFVGVGLAVVAGGVVLSGAVTPGKNLFAKMFQRTDDVDVISLTVKSDKLEVIVKEKGALESMNNQEGRCEVEGGTTVISILPEGQPVKKGQLVVELDKAALETELNNQRITTEQAVASYQQARLNREVAEKSVDEYREGIYKQESDTLDGEIALAESDVARSEDRLEWTKRMFDKGYVSKAQVMSEQRGLDNFVFQLKTANSRRWVLDKFTKDKNIKQLISEVEKFRSDELAKKASLQIEQDKQKKLERQIVNCNIYAPGDGLIVYANETDRRGGQEVVIAEGVQVRQRQVLFRLPDINNMRVNTKIHESMVERVVPGLPAKIVVDAFPNQVLNGTVDSINPLADPPSWMSSDIKQFTAFVKINGTVPGLRPGMSAQVTILVQTVPKCIAVPMQAILPFDGKRHVYVKGPGGGFERREVKTGTSNDQVIEVKEGVLDGDVIALNPLAFLSEDDKAQMRRVSGGNAAGGEGWGAGAAAAPGAPGAGAAPADGKGAPEAQGKGAGGARRKGGGMGNFDPAVMEKFKNASPEEKAKMIEEFQAKGGGGGMGGGRGGFGGDPAKAAEWKKKMESMTPEERQKMREQFRGAGGGNGGGGGGFGS